jgi:guanylate cyclase soluble subunit beta
VKAIINNVLISFIRDSDRLLYSVLPPTVANELRHGRPVPARRFSSVTLLFSGIVGFTQLCIENSDSQGARVVVDILNRLYSAIDALTESGEHKNIYKVYNI